VLFTQTLFLHVPSPWGLHSKLHLTTTALALLAAPSAPSPTPAALAPVSLLHLPHPSLRGQTWGANAQNGVKPAGQSPCVVWHTRRAAEQWPQGAG